MDTDRRRSKNVHAATEHSVVDLYRTRRVLLVARVPLSDSHFARQAFGRR